MRRNSSSCTTLRSLRAIVAIVLAASPLGGCVSPSVPHPLAVPVPGQTATPIVRRHADASPHLDPLHALDARAIRVLVWNVQKGRADDWQGDFRTLAANSDLVLLQEAHLHPDFTRAIGDLPRWDLVEAWRWRHSPTGVLSASLAPSLRADALGHREPLLRTAKSALITEYRLAGSARTLLVANIHAINFTFDTEAFEAQLLAVADRIDDHDGPVILCGDLNTWSAERRAVLGQIAAELSLSEVHFTGPRKQFRQHPLDHVFYRDLGVVAASVARVDSSDHNPLLVTFRAPEGLFR